MNEKKNRNEIKCINSINIKTTQITPTHTKKNNGKCEYIKCFILKERLIPILFYYGTYFHRILTTFKILNSNF